MKSNFLIPVPSCTAITMATWYDVPAEFKQNILAFLTSQLRVRFTTRFVTTRSTTAKKLDEKEIKHDDAITSLLLVSKSFLTYAEIETALLHGATIALNETRNLYEIEKRFKRTGLASIKELYATKEYNDWRHSSVDMLPSAAALKKLTSLQRLIFHLAISPPLRFFDTNISLNNLMRIAGGHHDASLTVYRDDARMLLARLLNYIGDRMQKHIVNWLLSGHLEFCRASCEVAS